MADRSMDEHVWISLTLIIELMDKILHLGCPKRSWYRDKANMSGALSGAGCFSINSMFHQPMSSLKNLSFTKLKTVIKGEDITRIHIKCMISWRVGCHYHYHLHWKCHGDWYMFSIISYLNVCCCLNILKCPVCQETLGGRVNPVRRVLSDMFIPKESQHRTSQNVSPIKDASAPWTDTQHTLWFTRKKPQLGAKPSHHLPRRFPVRSCWQHQDFGLRDGFCVSPAVLKNG